MYTVHTLYTIQDIKSETRQIKPIQYTTHLQAQPDLYHSSFWFDRFSLPRSLSLSLLLSLSLSLYTPPRLLMPVMDNLTWYKAADLPIWYYIHIDPAEGRGGGRGMGPGLVGGESASWRGNLFRLFNRSPFANWSVIAVSWAEGK